MVHTTGFQDFIGSSDFQTEFHGADKQKVPQEMHALFERYCRDGYIVHDFGIDPELIDSCAEQTEGLHGKYVRVQDMWRRSAAVKQLAAYPAITDFLSMLYQRRAFPFQTLNFPVGTQQTAHSDAYHFNSFPERYMCGVWVALEDVDMDNGPLRYYPGSHELPILSRAEIALSDAYKVSKYFEQMARRYRVEYGTIKKGQALIWSANLLHGGENIKDPARTRLSQVTHYYFDDCLYLTPANSDPEIGDVRLREPYDISQGRFVRGKLNGREVPGDWRERVAWRIWNITRYCYSVTA